MNYTDKEYEYKGFEYRTYDDVEPDNIKTFHLCFKDGKEVKMPQEFYNTSPYRKVKYEDFVEFVKQVELVEFVRG